MAMGMKVGSGLNQRQWRHRVPTGCHDLPLR